MLSGLNGMGWLTGSEIKKQVDNGRIQISPFSADQLNPNSYNYRLSHNIKRLTNEIKELYPDVKIIVGGQVFKNADSLKQIKYDYLMNSFDDILSFRIEVVTS